MQFSGESGEWEPRFPYHSWPAPATGLQASRGSAFALDAAVFDLAYITSPVLASVLAVGAAPAAALAVLLTLTGAAVIAIGKQPPGSLGAPAYPRGDAGGPRLPQEPPERASEPVRGAGSAPEKGSRLGPLRSAALRELLVTAALANVALTATEVALTAYVRHHHALWASGPLLAEVSIGSILGSLLFGARGAASGAHPYRRLPGLLAGLCLGPTLATLFGAAAVTAARHRREASLRSPGP